MAVGSPVRRWTSGRRRRWLPLLLALLMFGFAKVGAPPHVSASPESSASSSLGDDVALGLYRNVFPNDLSALDAYESQSGKRTAIVHWFALWGGWKSALDPADLQAASARGLVPLITWEPWAGEADDSAWSLKAGILSGRHDRYIAEWAKTLAAYGQPVLLRFAHEMHHQPAYPWSVGVYGNTAEDYLSAWRHVRAIFARHGARNVQWVWNPNTLGDAPLGAYEAEYRALYPGDDAVDWVGLDVYNTGPNLDWGAPYWRRPVDILATPYEAVTRIATKPVLLAEVGSAETGGDKAAWVAEVLTETFLARFPRLRAIVWFDINKEESWAIGSTPEAVRAFLSGWQSGPFTSSSGALRPSVGERGNQARSGG